MKQIFYTLIIWAALFSACKKSDIQVTPLASINIVNATVNSTVVKANFTNNTGVFGTTSLSVGYGGNTVYPLPAGNNIPVTITATADTLHPVYYVPISAASGDYYSLYLCGQTGAIESILMKDNFTTRQDSTFGIRIVNLSFNSGPINMTLSTATTTNEIANIAYKTVSDFKAYPCKATSPAVTFQLRDAATGKLLGSQAFTVGTMPRFHNVTLVLRGMVGGTGSAALGLQMVKNY